MDIAKVVNEIRKLDFLNEASFFDTCVFYYMFGRYPDMTIRDCVDVVNQVRSEYTTGNVQ